MTEINRSISNKIANLSFVCALIVVHIHYPKERLGQGYTYGEWTWIMDFIHRVFPAALNRMAVPFFFIASGFLIAHHLNKEGWWAVEVKKRLGSLVLPYVIINLLVGAVFAANHVLAGEGGVGVAYWLRAVGVYGWEPPAVGPFWYIRTLFLLVLALPLFAPVVRRGCRCALAFCLLCWLLNFVIGWLILNVPATVPVLRYAFSSYFKPWCLAFFLLGVTLGYYRLPAISPLTGAVCCVVGMALSIWAIALCPQGTYEGTTVPFMSLAFFSCPLLIAGMWTLTPDKSWPKWMRESTFPIYIWHFVFIRIVCGAIESTKGHFPGKDFYNMISGNPYGYFVGMAVLVAASVSLSMALRKVPLLNRMFQGGR